MFLSLYKYVTVRVWLNCFLIIHITLIGVNVESHKPLWPMVGNLSLYCGYFFMCVVIKDLFWFWHGEYEYIATIVIIKIRKARKVVG